MKLVPIVSLGLAFLIAVSHAAERWPLVIAADSTWRIEYSGDGVHFFTITRPEGENILLMLSKWPAPGGSEQIPVFLRRMADSFMQKVRANEIPYVTAHDYRVEDIVGDSFSGEAAVFATADGLLQTMFMISDGNGIWNGQFSGSSSMWQKAKKILEGIRRAEN